MGWPAEPSPLTSGDHPSRPPPSHQASVHSLTELPSPDPQAPVSLRQPLRHVDATSLPPTPAPRRPAEDETTLQPYTELPSMTLPQAGLPWGGGPARASHTPFPSPLKFWLPGATDPRGWGALPRVCLTRGYRRRRPYWKARGTQQGV